MLKKFKYTMIYVAKKLFIKNIINDWIKIKDFTKHRRSEDLVIATKSVS